MNSLVSTIINPNPLKLFWQGTLPNPPKSSSALLETCPYLQNAPHIFVDLSYSALMGCTSWPGSNFAPFEEVKVPVSKSADFFLLSAPLEDFGGSWVVRVYGMSPLEYYFSLWEQEQCTGSQAWNFIPAGTRPHFLSTGHFH